MCRAHAGSWSSVTGCGSACCTDLNELAGRPLAADALFRICAELEGHPDNAAPAAFGGFTVAGGAEIARFEVAPELRFVLLIPDFEISTPAARKVLPAQLDRLAAARSCANACRITAAFATKNYGLLRGAFVDQLHQPFREKELIPFLSKVIAAGEGAGALGGFLSGSGSTICCVTEEKDEGGGHRRRDARRERESGRSHRYHAGRQRRNRPSFMTDPFILHPSSFILP